MRKAALPFVLSLGLIAVWATTGSAASQTPGCLPTSARTIGPHGFPGLGVKRVAPVYTDAFQFVSIFHESPAKTQSDVAQLQSEGFVSGTWQHYRGKRRKTRGDEGAALAEQLGSPEQAQSEFSHLVADALGVGRWKRFTVPAIPGSRGLRQSFHGEGASNLYFADGSYAYFVGRFVARGGTGTRQVISAARKLYNRVHGAPVCL